MFPKVHSFLKQCLQDLNFMKTRPFSPNLSKLVGLTSAEGHCFHILKNTISKMNLFSKPTFLKMGFMLNLRMSAHKWMCHAPRFMRFFQYFDICGRFIMRSIFKK